MRYLFSSKLNSFSRSDWGRFLFEVEADTLKEELTIEGENPYIDSPEVYSQLGVAPEEGFGQLWREDPGTKNKVEAAIAPQATIGALTEERKLKHRTPEEALGFFFFRNKFDRRQSLNPFWWFKIKLLTKDSIIKNMRNAANFITSPYKNSPLKYSRLQKALLTKTAGPTFSAISSGRINKIDQVSLLALEDMEASIVPLFDQISNDVSRRIEFAGEALKNREWPKKTIYLQGITKTDKRLAFAGQHILKEIDLAKKEVLANIAHIKDERRKRIESTQNAIENYKLQQKVSGDTGGKRQLWEFLKKASDSPSLFLKSKGIFKGFNWKKALGVDCAVDILDTIQTHYSDFIISTDRLARVYDTMEATIENVKVREKNKEEYAPKADFVRLQKSLRSLKIEMAPEGSVSDIQSVVDDINSALQRPPLNIDLEKKVYKGAEIRLTNEERVFYLVNYLNENPKSVQALDDDAKQVLSRWLYDTSQSAEAKYMAGGFTTEEAPINLRKYALENALRVQNLSKKAVAVLPQLNVAIRKKDPKELQDILQQLKGFVASYDDLFEVLEGEYGEGDDTKKLIDKLPPSEREVVENLRVLSSFKNRLDGKEGMDGIIKKLEDTRNKFDEEVLKKMLPNENIYLEWKKEAADIRKTMKAMEVSSGGITFEQTQYNALQKTHEDLIQKVLAHETALQAQQSDYLDLPPSADAWEKIVGELKNEPIQRQLAEMARDEVISPEELKMPDANDMMRRMLLNKGAKEMEVHFKEVLRVRSAQQWDILSQSFIDGGFSIPKLHYTNTTRQNRELTVPGGVMNEKILNNVVVVRKEGSQFVCETADKKQVVILKMREGKNIEAFIWDHPGGKNWTVPQTEPKTFATVLNMKIDDGEERGQKNDKKHFIKSPHIFRRAA